MKEYNEIILIRSAQKGDEYAWRELFNEHFEGVYSFCLRLAGGNANVAEDVTQRVFVTAAIKINRFKTDRSTFRAWLFGIAKISLLKVRTKEARQKHHETEFLKTNTANNIHRPEELYVYETLAKLPGHYRAVLECKYLKGITVNQIAREQNTTPKAVESLLTRARKRFAQAYGQNRE